jgi:hypothetical protein
MKTYTVTVKPNSNAFAALMRFDLEVVIEFEHGDESAEVYTVASQFPLDTLLDAAPGLVGWDDAPSAADYNFDDFPPDDPEPPDAPAKFQDWTCFEHPSSGWHEAKWPPKPIEKVTDFALTKLIDDPATAATAAAEWRRRYPHGVAYYGGVAIWAQGYDRKVKTL